MTDIAAREAARRTSGQFGDQPHSDPEVTLNGLSSENAAALAEALDRYELTTADLPGIEAAWHERFGRLDDPRPEREADVIRSLLTDLDIDEDESIKVDMVNPKSNGTLLVGGHIDGHGYQSLDLEGDDITRFLLARENGWRADDWEALEGERKLYTSGARPTWHVLLDKRTLQGFHDAVRLSRTTPAAAVHAKTIGALDAVDVALAEGRALTAAEQALFPSNGHGRKELAICNSYGFSQYGNGNPIILPSEVSRISVEAATTARDLAAANAVFGEASNLPDGPLRDFLLAERPRKTYSSEPGKTYPDHSELQKLMIDVPKKAAAAEVKLAELRTGLALIRTNSAGFVQDAEDRAAKHQQAIRDAHLAGWPGDPADVPAPLPVPELPAF